MKSIVIFMFVVVTLGMSGIASGVVLLDETFFDPNLFDWAQLDTPSAGTVRLDINQTYGTLAIVEMADNDMFMTCRAGSSTSGVRRSPPSASSRTCAACRRSSATWSRPTRCWCSRKKWRDSAALPPVWRTRSTTRLRA